MPYLSFYANFLWVMVIGLLGPSIPAIVRDLGISYSQAGLFFTMLSLGSLFGTFFGGLATDHLNRKTLFIIGSVILFAGLIGMGFASHYIIILLIILLFSLLGSPIGAIGQSIMLQMFPAKREKYLSYQTMFAALGSFIAPLLIALNLSLNLNWKSAFMEAGVFTVFLIVGTVFIKIPERTVKKAKIPLKDIVKNRYIRICAVLVFLSMALDIGFSYWLAEYFTTELDVSMRLSSAIVGIYLAGIITARLSLPLFLKYLKGFRIMQFSLILALISLLFFILLPVNGIKAVFCFFYGLGIGPIFPLIIARGVKTYPGQPGAVTGVLFAAMSFGGMVFPIFTGFLAQNIGIANSYYFNVLIAVCLLLIITIWTRKRDLKTTF